MAKNLSSELREAWQQAPEGETVLRIHLFAIKNAADLEGVSLRDLVAAADIPRPYATEIRKGIRLADFVTLK